SLQPRNDAFEKVILKLKQFALEALGTKNITVDFKMDEALSDLRISAVHRKDLFLIYKEAINNILKHAQCRKVEIEIKGTRNSFVMRIKDDGIGFRKSLQGSGNGLHSMQERVKSLQGELQIISEPGSGTEVWLKFEI
ncbi:MAG: sensor histidine kinase, partial [Chitinophagales bacterium]